MRKINKIIVHCSATPEGINFTVEDINRWHVQKGYKKIGYHYVIYRDGSCHVGRDLEEVGAHCTGQNTDSIGICYIGGCTTNNTPKDTRTPEQKRALLSLIKDLKKKYPGIEVHGHRDYANKACPSFDATTEYKNI